MESSYECWVCKTICNDDNAKRNEFCEFVCPYNNDDWHHQLRVLRLQIDTCASHTILNILQKDFDEILLNKKATIKH